MGNDGWICLHRKALSNGWLRNHKLWVFWCYCLLKASHKENKVMIGTQQVTLQPGQFVFGRKTASKETGLSEQSIRTYVHNLYTWGNLTIKSTNKYSLITVVNWELYQSKETKITSKLTSNQPATNHIQQCNNVTSNKSIRLSEYLASLILKNNPSHKGLFDGKYKQTIKRWVIDIDRMIRLDKRPVDEVEKVIRWCQADQFWCSIILSGRKLREKYDQLLILMQTRNQSEKKGGRLADQYPTL